MKEHILVVEDDESMRGSLKLVLEGENFAVTTAADGFEAIKMAKVHPFDLVVADVRMPGMDGLSTLRLIRSFQPKIRAIIVTAYPSHEAPVEAIKLQVDDYLVKPFDSGEFLESVRKSIKARRDAKIDERSGVRTRESFLKILSAISLETNDRYLRGHSERVAGYCLWMARKLNFSKARSHALRLAALLHDIGQIEMPAYLLRKADSLTEEEYEMIRGHAAAAGNLLEPFKDMEEVARIILHHHEWFNGEGYPQRLKQDKIPLESRMLAIAEAYDSLTSERPYRRKMDGETAFQILRQKSGSQFDPALLDLWKHYVYAQIEAPAEEFPSAEEIPVYTRQAMSLIRKGRLFTDIGE